MKFEQGSTWRGLALMGSAVAGFMGYGHLFSVDVSASGLNFGGAVGVAVPLLVGAYDALRDEFR